MWDFLNALEHTSLSLHSSILVRWQKHEEMTILVSAATLPSTTTNLSLNLSKDCCTETLPATSLRLSTGLRKKNNNGKKVSHICLSVKNQSTIQTTQRNSGKITPRKGVGKLILSEGKDEDERHGFICPGCGVFMQDKDPNSPGYYQKKKVTATEMSEGIEDLLGDDLGEFDEGEEEFMDGIEGKFEESDGEEDNLEREDEFAWDSEEWEGLLDEEDDELKELDGFSPAGVGYGNVTEEIVEKRKKKKMSKAEKKRMAREAAKEKEEATVCARCHSLRNYGQVKNQTAENLIPDFDFDRLITTRLMKPTGNADATVVVMVVDCVDFDGSFPKRAAKSLFKALEGTKNDLKLCKKLPKLVLVATKVDLLPSQISPTRLDRWVRHRARAGGAPKLSGVYLVSARKDLGVRSLLSFIKDLAGPRGNVWVIGAQNAGKSTLINAFAKREGVKITELTEAAVPGTKLGILKI